MCQLFSKHTIMCHFDEMKLFHSICPTFLEEYQYLDEASLTLCTKVGLATTHFSTIGVYHYRIADSPAEFNTCSVIVNPGPKVGKLPQISGK